MDKFQKFEARLNEITSRIEVGGFTPEIEAELMELFQNASVLVLLGPNETFERSEEDSAREWADGFDLDYYKDTFGNVDYPVFFKSDYWGEAAVVYEEHVIDGKPSPMCRISWQHKIAFVRQAESEEGTKMIEAHLSYFAMVLGCRWYRWKIELA